MARQTARSDIRYDGTTEETWEPPTLADYAVAMGLEEVNTTGDLTAEQKRRIAAMTLMGEARASRFDELQSYPVVGADGRLNRNALDAARRLRGQSNDPEGIERVTRQLLNEEFDAGIEKGAMKPLVGNKHLREVSRPESGDTRVVFYTPTKRAPDGERLGMVAEEVGTVLGIEEVPVDMKPLEEGVLVGASEQTAGGIKAHPHPLLDVIESAIHDRLGGEKSVIMVAGSASGMSVQPVFRLGETLPEEAVAEIRRLYEHVAGILPDVQQSDGRLRLDTRQDRLGHIELDVAEIVVRRIADARGVQVNGHTFETLPVVEEDRMLRRSKEVPDVDITVPEKVVNAAQAGLDAKEEYDLGDCGTGRGEERARQIIQGDLKPEDFVTRERGTSIPTYLDSHSEDAPSTDAPPTDWTEEEWTDGCGPVQLALWGYYLDWAQSQEQKIRDAMDSRATRMHGGVEQPFAVFDTAIMGDAAGQEGYFYPCYLSKERADAASFTGGCHEHNFESFTCSVYMPDEPMTHAGDEAPAMPVYHSEAAMRSAGQVQTRADVSDLSEGDYVRWDSSGGTAYGMIDMIAMGETVSGSLEPDDVEHETGEDNPGVIIQLVDRDEDGEIEGEMEDGEPATVFHRPSTLTRISEDDIPERALEITREALGLRGDMHEKMERMDEMTSEVSRMAEDMRKMYGGEKDEEMSAPAVKKSAADSVARHCRDNQKTYQRDFASWDGPSSKVTRASTGDRVDVTINSRAEDRHGTIILPRGARLERYNNDNPVVLINHNHDLPAGVSTVSVRESGEPVLQAQQRKDEWHTSDPRIEPWFEKVMGEPQIVRSASIGAMFHEVVPGRDYDGIERLVDTDGRDPRDLPDVVTDWSLVEWSWVTVPSNPEANVTENGQRSLSHDFYDQNTSVPSNASRSRPSPQGRDEPPAEGSDLDEPSDDGTQRSLSTEQAKVLLRDTISEEIDRRTGRK